MDAAKNEFYVSYRTSWDGPTSTCMALAECAYDVLAEFALRGAFSVSVTPKECAPSWMGEGKKYSTVICGHFPVGVECNCSEDQADSRAAGDGDRCERHAKRATLDDVVKGAFAEATSHERVQELVERKVTDALEGWIDSALTGYNNPVQQAFKSRIQELIVPTIENVRLDNARLDVLLDSLIRHSAIGERAQILDRFGRLVMPDVEDVAKASDIFDSWTKFVARDYDCDGREVVLDDGPRYVPLKCTCELVEHDRSSWSVMRHATVTLEVEDCDEDQAMDFNRELDLWRFDDYPSDENLWYVHYPPSPSLKDIRTASSFDLLLARLDAHSTPIRWDLGSHEQDVYPEQQPEADWM